MARRSTGWRRRSIAVLAPMILIGLGYVGAGPSANLLFDLNVALSGNGADYKRSHIDEVAALSVPTAAGYLFRIGGKGPRADRYEQVGEVAVITHHPQPIVAAVSPIDIEVGHADTPRRRQIVVNRSGKTARLNPPVTNVAKGPGGANPYELSAALFLATPNAREVANFGPALPASESEARVQLASLTPERIKRDGLDFQGESEDEYVGRQRRCLATAIYFEARGEPIRGQLAVAQVIMNRVRTPLYPDTICGVVFQGQWNKNQCQFSFACDGQSDIPKSPAEWSTANELAKRVTDGKVWLSDIGYATHYHATYVRPRWVGDMKKIKTIGRHVFYVMKDVDEKEEAAREGRTASAADGAAQVKRLASLGD